MAWLRLGGASPVDSPERFSAQRTDVRHLWIWTDSTGRTWHSCRRGRADDGLVRAAGGAPARKRGVPGAISSAQHSLAAFRVGEGERDDGGDDKRDADPILDGHPEQLIVVGSLYGEGVPER